MDNSDFNLHAYTFISYHSYYLQSGTLPDKRCLSRDMCYQVMMTLHFLNVVANDAESTQKSKITS